MFTLADICNIAVQIEHNGEAVYRRAAGQATDQELARVLLWLAEEERLHGELFAAIAKGRKLSSGQAELEAMGRALLQDIVKSQTFSLNQQQINQAGTLRGLLDQSIEFEQDTIQFYEFLSGFLEDQESIAQVALVIAQEKGHVRTLEAMRVVEKPMPSGLRA